MKRNNIIIFKTGSKTERGMFRWQRMLQRRRTDKSVDIYDLPFLRRRAWFIYLPFMPSFTPGSFKLSNMLAQRRASRMVAPTRPGRRRSSIESNPDQSRSRSNSGTTNTTGTPSRRTRDSIGNASNVTGWYNKKVNMN